MDPRMTSQSAWLNLQFGCCWGSQWHCPLSKAPGGQRTFKMTRHNPEMTKKQQQRMNCNRDHTTDCTQTEGKQIKWDANYSEYLVQDSRRRSQQNCKIIFTVNCTRHCVSFLICRQAFSSVCRFARVRRWPAAGVFNKSITLGPQIGLCSQRLRIIHHSFNA